MIFEFKMAKDGTHAQVLVDGKEVGTITNSLDEGFVLSRDSSKHGVPLPVIGAEVWDQFNEWVNNIKE